MVVDAGLGAAMETGVVMEVRVVVMKEAVKEEATVAAAMEEAMAA